MKYKNPARTYRARTGSGGHGCATQTRRPPPKARVAGVDEGTRPGSASSTPTFASRRLLDALRSSSPANERPRGTRMKRSDRLRAGVLRHRPAGDERLIQLLAGPRDGGRRDHSTDRGAGTIRDHARAAVHGTQDPAVGAERYGARGTDVAIDDTAVAARVRSTSGHVAMHTAGCAEGGSGLGRHRAIDGAVGTAREGSTGADVATRATGNQRRHVL